MESILSHTGDGAIQRRRCRFLHRWRQVRGKGRLSSAGRNLVGCGVAHGATSARGDSRKRSPGSTTQTKSRSCGEASVASEHPKGVREPLEGRSLPRSAATVEQVRVMNDHVKTLALPRGLYYDFESYTLVNTFDAHRLTHLAKAHGLGAECTSVPSGAADRGRGSRRRGTRSFDCPPRSVFPRMMLVGCSKMTITQPTSMKRSVSSVPRRQWGAVLRHRPPVRHLGST